MQKQKKKTSDALPMAHNVVLTPIDELLPYAANARTHSADQVKRIAASIKEFGFNNPILVDGAKGVIAGHGRLEAAKKLKLGTVPVIELAHLTDAQKRAYILADNRLALDAGWDDATLAVEMKRLQEDAFDLGLTGFSQEEIDKLLGGTPVTEGLTDEEEVPEDVPAIAQRGQVWKLGRHRLMCGDSTCEEDVARLMDGKRASFCFTSPPYSDQREYNGGKDLSTQKLAKFLQAPCDLFAVNLGLQRKDGEVCPYWDDYITAAKSVGLRFLSWNVWDRLHACSIGQHTAMFPIEHEWILVFGATAAKLNRIVPNKTAGQKYTGTNREIDGRMSGRRVETTGDFRPIGTVMRCDVHRGDAPHPAMFPVSLPEAYIEACTQRDENVLEPFGGSGSTLIACEKTGRLCFMMELDEKYCDVIISRWEAFTGLKAELVQ